MRDRTSVEFEDSAAIPAQEMVMVSLPCDLIPRRLSWHLYGLEPTLFDQAMNIPIDSCDTHTLCIFVCMRQNLFGRERSI